MHKGKDITLHYYVGDVARLLGITPSALRFYEKQKIIHTQKTESGRRYYDLGDIARLLSAKKYTAMGIPIKQVVQQFQENGDDRHVIGRRVRGKIEEAQEKAAYYRVLADIVESHAQAIEDIDSHLHTFSLFLRPKTYMLTDPANYLISKDPQRGELMTQWVQAMPATRYAFLLRPEAFPDGDSVFLGYIVPAQQAEALHMPLPPSLVETFEETLCLRTIIVMDNSFLHAAEVFQNMETYRKEKKLQAAGISIACLTLVESITDDHYRSYLDVTTPIKL